MYNLSEQQIEYILNDIRRNGVEMEDLQLNLLDHICCIIEQNLKEGDDFEDFYRKTVKQFCKHELWEIEEETIILLTIKNYYVMKKSMIISGTISVAALLFGSFLKIMHWPGANVMLLLGIVTFSFVFLPLMLFLKTKEAEDKRDKLIIGVGTLVGILLCISVLFAIMHWPGRTPLWIITCASSMFLLIPLYFFTGIRKPEAKINTIIITIILVGATGLQFMMINIRPSKTIEVFNFFANQDLVATRNYATEQNNNRYKIILNDSTPAKTEMKELKNRSNELYKKIEKIKLDMVNSIEDRNETIIDYETHLLFNHEDNQPNSILIDLKNDVDSFNTFIKTTYSKNSFGMINTKGTKDVNGDGHIIPWEVFNFYHVPFGIILRNLTQMQLDIRVVEATNIH
jgi:hypothetical protein